MSGERNLSLLLQNMRPILRDGHFVFCGEDTTVPRESLKPLGTFREAEGVTLILSKAQADAAGLRYDAAFRMITLGVESSLEAVGFLAAVSTRLAEHGISVSAVSALYHDHLFVPVDRAGEAVALLRDLQAESGGLLEAPSRD